MEANMGQKEYEYHGLLASSWDLLRGDTSDWPDRPFYRQIIIETGQPALDVGCGTGRLLLDYLSQGLDVDGVDNSPEMLDICRRKGKEMGLNPDIYLQPMEDLDLPRNYRAIFVSSSSFQLLTDLGSAKKALEAFYRHLMPRGVLVMSMMDISSEAATDWQMVAEETRPEDEVMVRRWIKVSFNPQTQLQDTVNRYELVKDGRVIYNELHEQSPATRNYNLEQITSLVADAGFDRVHALSGFTDQPAAADDDVFCIFGKRP